MEKNLGNFKAESEREKQKNEFDVIACPEIIAAGKPFSLLLEVNEPCEIKVNSPIVSQFDDDVLSFEKEGLYALRLICNMIVNDLTFTLEGCSHTAVCKVLRSVEKPEDDGVVTGISDIIYTEQDEANMEDFLKFFMQNHIGNLMTLRPVYECSETKADNLVPLMEKLGVKYATCEDKPISEQMYGSLEFITAAMRGAHKSHGKTNGFGTYNGLRWSALPHSVPEKLRRYRLALYLCYMHGVSEINLEEGLYHIEEYFSDYNSFSNRCKAFLKEQQDFYRYTLSHTRTGSFHTPIALLHGRCDDFSGFKGGESDGGDDYNLCDAEASWDILKLFYPASHLDNADVSSSAPDKPLGFYTGTPRGNLDIIPIEKGAFEHYKALCFTGYNKAEEGDLNNLLAFVHTGGTLIAGWPHFSYTANRKDVEDGSLSILKHKLTDYLASDCTEFISDSYCGIPVKICPNAKFDDVIATTDSGYPLLGVRRIGLGQIFFVNALQYPAHKAVKPLYEAAISEISDNLNAEKKVFLSCGKDIGFTIYDQKDGAVHLYVLAVDWYNDPEAMRKATLRIGKQKYSINVPFGSMLKIVAKDNLAVWSEDESVEVLLITSNVVTLQGYGKTKIKYAKDGEVCEREIDFTHKPIQAIQI